MESIVFGLSIVQVILCVFLIVVVVMQQSHNRWLPGAISGGTTDTFYSKNKSRSRESRLSRATIIGMILLVIVTLAINIIG